MRAISGFFTSFLVFATSAHVHASLHLSDIQALVGFPQQCTDAYNTPIDDCNGAHFSSGPLCSCSSACSSALDAITNTIINACQGTDASQNTLIGLFYDHAATSFLCSPPANGGGGGCGTGAAGSSSSSSSQQSASSQASSTTSSTTQTNSSTTTTQTSSSMHSTNATTSMTMSSSATTSPTSTPRSVSSSTMSSTHSTHSTTSKVTSNQSKPTTGGGSPFDISPSAGTRANVQTQPVVVMLLLFSAVIGLAWS